MTEHPFGNTHSTLVTHTHIHPNFSRARQQLIFPPDFQFKEAGRAGSKYSNSDPLPGGVGGAEHRTNPPPLAWWREWSSVSSIRVMSAGLIGELTGPIVELRLHFYQQQ